jgi:hypothetical protein
MEALITSSLSLSDAEFFVNIKKVVYNTRRTFDFFKEAVAVCKALFKSKHYDSKQKYYALLVGGIHPRSSRR